MKNVLIKEHHRITFPISVQVTTFLMQMSTKIFPKRSSTTELHKMNREHHRYLCYEAENQQLFVAFVLPSSGMSLLQHTIFLYLQNETTRWQDECDKINKNWPQPPSAVLGIYSTLYFVIYLCGPTLKSFYEVNATSAEENL